MQTLSEIVGGMNMVAAAKESVIGILAALPLPPTSRRYLYARWCSTVGLELKEADTGRVGPLPSR